MRRYVPFALAGLAGLLMAATPASAAAPIVRSVERLVPIRQGDVVVTTLPCPSGMAALGGGVISQPTGSVLRGSIPSSVSRWRFRFGGYEGARQRFARVALRCVALDLRGDTTILRTATSTDRVTVGALNTASTTLTCPRGFLPTAWGFERRPPGSSSPLGPEETQIYRALASGRTFDIGIENLGGADESVRVRARCVQQRTRTREGLVHSFRIRNLTYRDRVRQGRDVEHHPCARGFFGLGTGHAVDALDDILFRVSFLRHARSGRWVFDNSSGTGDLVRTQLLCLNRGTNFRR
jgi:hypothetical protein